MHLPLKTLLKNKFSLTFLFVCVCTASLSAQQNLGGDNMPYADDKFIHFGYSLGVGAMDFGATASNVPINDSVYNSAVSSLQPLFSVGIIADMRLHRYLNLRFTPTLYFGTRTLTYSTGSTAAKPSISVSSIPINIPLSIKFSSERKGNCRPYLIWGAGVGFDLATDTEKPILLRKLNYFTEFGVGCDLYFTFFKLCPELKFNLGLNNVLTPLDERVANGYNPGEKDKLYTTALSKLRSRMITLAFNFE